MTVALTLAEANCDVLAIDDKDDNVQDIAEKVSYRMTNVGTFRAYLQEYLRHHPRIRQDMTLMVRQLAPDANGLPIEIYCFTNTVAVSYTHLQRSSYSISAYEFRLAHW